jgi:hypothetical protein
MKKLLPIIALSLLLIGGVLYLKKISRKPIMYCQECGYLGGLSKFDTFVSGLVCPRCKEPIHWSKFIAFA